MTCIITTRSLDKDGYGRIVVGGVRCREHRLAYAKAHGLDVATMGGLIMHSCNNRACINPAHLSMGTHKDNSEHMVKCGRSGAGESSPSALLTAQQVRNIRDTYVFRHKEYGGTPLALKYCVSKQTISAIVNNKGWVDG